MNIQIIGDIGQHQVNMIAEALEAGETSISLYINSPGGDLEAGFAIYQLLRSRPLNLSVKVDGCCASAAILPLLAVPVENREATSTSSFLIHSPICYAGDLNLQSAERLTTDLRSANDELCRIYRERTVISDDVMETYMQNQTWFYAELAKQFGFIGKISQMYNKAMPENPSINTKTYIKKMNFIQQIFRKLLNACEVVETVDGQQLEVAGELEVGAVINVNDGVYQLVDGQIITTKGGVVIDVDKPVEEKEEKEEEKEETPVETPVETPETLETPAEPEPVVTEEPETKEEPEPLEIEEPIDEKDEKIAELEAQIEELKKKLEETKNELVNYATRRDMSNSTTESKVDYRKYWK